MKASTLWIGAKESPFVRLVRHFFLRFFDSDVTGGEEDSQIGTGGLLAILAMPGAAMSLVLFGKYSSLMRWFQRDLHFDPIAASVPDKYAFIAFSMTITGLVTVLKWDSLFPDRRDYANLAPLPLTDAETFFAKLAALLLFVLLFIVDVNGVSAILFPLIVMEERGTFFELLRFWGAHAVSVAAASLFTFCSLLATIGFLMTALPYVFFRRITRYVQLVFAAGLLLLFFSVPAVTSALKMAGTNNTTPTLMNLPPAWFLSLYTGLQGHALSALTPMNGVAVRALACSIIAAAFFYAVSYRAYYLRTAETPEVGGGSRRLPNLVFAVLDRVLLRDPFERTCFRFSLRTLFRSDRHCAILAGGLGLGTALAVQSAAVSVGGSRATAGELGIALTIVYFLVTSLRFSFGIPAELRSNWIFQTALTHASPNARSVARKILWALVMPVLAGAFLLHAVEWGVPMALLHCLYVAIMGAFLIELMLANYRAIPYTCADMPGRGNFVLALAIYAAGYVIFGRGLAALEQWVFSGPGRVIILIFFGAFAAFGIRHMRDDESKITYEGDSESVLLLRLSE